MIDQISSLSHLSQYERLLAQTFPVPADASFYDDFPVWDPEHVVAHRMRAGVILDDQVVAGASARVARLRTPRGPVSVAVIGGVCCHPDYRGKGYASRLVEILVGWAEGQDAQAQLLWSTELAMYERLGFHPSGTQVRYSLESLKFPRSEQAVVREGWHPGIWQLVKKRRDRGLILEDADRGWYEAHKNTRWCWLEEDGGPTAFAAIGRGIDLPGMIHEWGGALEPVRALLGHLAVSDPSLIVLGSPDDKKTLSLVELMSEPLCLMRGGADIGAYWIWGLDAG